MKKITILLLAATMTAAGTAVADELEDMMKKNGCNACHAEDKKVIGPSYKDVANKYKGDATAAAKLADKVKKGGSGVWGPVPMPPNPTVKDDDVKKMVQLILTLKK
jgi:cytochrome c